MSAQSSVLRDGQVDNVSLSLSRYILLRTLLEMLCTHHIRLDIVRLYQQHTYTYIRKLITPTRKAEENTRRTQSAVSPGGNGRESAGWLTTPRNNVWNNAG